MKPKKKYDIKKLYNKKQLNNYYNKIEYLWDDKDYLKELEDEIKLNGSMKGKKI